MRNFFLFLLMVVVIGGFAGYKMWTKPHRNMAIESSAETLTAQELVAAYNSDEAAADKRFLDQAVLITGRIAEITTNDAGEISLLLDGGDGRVTCVLDMANKPDAGQFKVGDSVRVQGVCTGKLLEVILSRCVVK